MAIDRRKQIIEAATSSFSLYGYKATTIDQVAKLANVGKGTIYTFFKNKEELFDEIINGLIIEMKAVANEAVSHSDSFYENVHRALYRLLEFRKQHQLTIKLSQEARDIGTPAVVEVMEKLELAILNFIKDKVVLAIKKGEIKECDPEITAFIMMKLYIALIFDWEKKHKPLGKAELSQLFEFYIFKGLST
ncbi:TetR/AcrR family transcriptional regulator [Mesobacillus subterraneus]|jgi:AcrR family transcriptional regulator|uniref:TetR/AcrR family transcriptional regulator n=1 Tax=Mesobacillus subterraneus TaxID=285983 RepID=UPI00203D36E0|nr:TetR/AcrR family transcriptional regulator [Mesobacillus subterraneus]MCM3662922.1 TetR/AcrR family transcriptional regulator [Mesobacillus subterraneus]MCM3682902.1 TetR/AcrR family transcriptional regulator [Mesobacillus subterraneus]